MFPLPQDGDGAFSAKPIPSVKPIFLSEAGDVPLGEELFEYVLDCLDKGSLKVEVAKQLIAFGYSAREAEVVVNDVAEWRRRNPDQLSIAKPSAAAYRTSSASMWVGGLACLLGATIIVGSFFTSDRGCASLIPFGMMTLLGASQFLRGLSRQDQA